MAESLPTRHYVRAGEGGSHVTDGSPCWCRPEMFPHVRIGDGSISTHEMLANVPDEDFMHIVREELKRRGGYSATVCNCHGVRLALHSVPDMIACIHSSAWLG